MPASARSQSTWCQSETKATATVSSDEAISAPSIIDLRPTTSDNEPANTIDSAIAPAVSDKASELSAAETPNSCVNSGRTGCTL